MDLASDQTPPPGPNAAPLDLSRELLSEIRRHNGVIEEEQKQTNAHMEKLIDRVPSARIVHVTAGMILVSLVALLAYAIGIVGLSKGIDPRPAAEAAKEVAGAAHADATEGAQPSEASP